MTMITSLFSSFDPISGLKIINYIPIFSLLIRPLIIEYIFFINSRNKKINLFIFKSVEREIRRAITNKFKSGKLNIILTLFFFILLINIRRLIPFVFTITAHIILNLSLVLPFWLGFIIFGLLKNTNHFFSHLVPLRTPLPLSQFIVIIETVRQIIRPITLSVRLAANITAGHILIGLARSNITIFNTSSAVLVILVILETAVAFIQRYVFTILLSIYLNEAYDKSKPPFPFSF